MARSEQEKRLHRTKQNLMREHVTDHQQRIRNAIHEMFEYYGYTPGEPRHNRDNVEGEGDLKASRYTASETG